MAIVVGWLGSIASIAQGELDADTDAGHDSATALHWVRLTGAHDCIGGHALARSVEAKLRRPIFSTASSFPLLIEGYVERREDGYRSELRMTALDGTLLGTRTLNSQAQDCRELSDTVAVVLAVMIDPEASIQTTPPVATPPVKVEPAPVPSALPAPREEAHVQTLIAFGRAGVKLDPGLALGIGAAYERALPRFGGLRAEAVGFREATARMGSDAQSGGAHLRLIYAGVAYCPLWFDTPAVRSSGCVGGELGTRYSEAFGFDDGDIDSGHNEYALWASVSARASVSVRVVSRVMVLVSAGFFVPVISQRYKAAGDDDVSVPIFRQASVGGIFDFGLGARF